MTTTTTYKATIKITMSERRPLSVVKAEWPLIARADCHDGAVECQANHQWTIRVREHADGRRLVYGWLRSGPGRVHAGWRGAEGGFLIEATRDLGEPRADHGYTCARLPDEAETIRAIRRVSGIIDNDRMADECIADLPSETVDATEPVHAVPRDQLALMLALLVRARPHCPADLQTEIHDLLSQGA